MSQSNELNDSAEPLSASELNEWRVIAPGRYTHEIDRLAAQVTELRQQRIDADVAMMVALDRVTELEEALDEELGNRDQAQEWADKLAYSIAPQSVIGEHSSMNNPWANALDVVAAAEHRIEELTAERDAANDRIVDLETDKAHRMCLGCTTHIAALSAQVEAYRGALERIASHESSSTGLIALSGQHGCAGPLHCASCIAKNALATDGAALSDKEDPTK